MVVKTNKEILFVKVDTHDKEMRKALHNYIIEAKNLSYLSNEDNQTYIKDTLAADYYVELLNLYKETGSLDNVALVMNAYKADPETFAQIEFEKAFFMAKNQGLTKRYLARRSGYDLTNKKENLRFISDFLKISKLESQYLTDDSTEEKKNRVIEMTKHFHKLYENELLFPKTQFYTK